MLNSTRPSSFDLERKGRELNKILEQIIYQKKKKTVLEKIYDDILNNKKIAECSEKLENLIYQQVVDFEVENFKKTRGKEFPRKKEREDFETLIHSMFEVIEYGEEGEENIETLYQEINKIVDKNNGEDLDFDSVRLFVLCFGGRNIFKAMSSEINIEITNLEIKKLELEKILYNFTATRGSREVGRAEIKQIPKKKLEQVYKKKFILYQANKKWDAAKPFLLIISLIAAVSLAVAFFLRKKLLSWISQKKHEDEKNYLQEIRTKFRGWRLSMYLCAIFYVIFFLVFKFLISVFVEPYIGDWLKKAPNWTVLSVTLFLGVLFILDSVITSMLKTPLQRLAIKIENSPFDEKIKKKLLTKTQEANELFKETFKKFGIIVIPVILTGLLGRNSAKLIFYLCYLVPILYASVRIVEVSNLITEKKKN